MSHLRRLSPLYSLSKPNQILSVGDALDSLFYNRDAIGATAVGRLMMPGQQIRGRPAQVAVTNYPVAVATLVCKGPYIG